jgi:hypothetical protein
MKNRSKGEAPKNKSKGKAQKANFKSNGTPWSGRAGTFDLCLLHFAI